MGFTEGESRTGLRVCQGDVTSAVEYVTKRREEKLERRKREKEEQKSRKLGKTADGNWVDCDIHKVLVEMGFPSSDAAEALRQGNNDIDSAIQTLQEHPELLCLPSTSGSQDINIPEEIVAQVVSMGFSPDVVRQTMQKHNGAIQAALEELLTSSGTTTSQPGPSEGSSSREDPEIEKALKGLASCVPEDEDAYLDINLDEEAAVINEYRTMLASLLL